METISREEHQAFWNPLAYFFGAWLGDGHYEWNPYAVHPNYRVGLCGMDEEILVKAVGSLNAQIKDVHWSWRTEELKSAKTFHRVAARNKDLVTFICMATAFKTALPEFVWDAPKIVKLEMLSGLMDTDGTIGISNRDNAYIMRFSGGKGFVSQVPDLFRVSGIKVISIRSDSRPGRRDCSEITVSVPSCIENGFRFYCKRKQYRLIDYIEKFYKGPKPAWFSDPQRLHAELSIKKEDIVRTSVKAED